jgi:hypothetical protein
VFLLQADRFIQFRSLLPPSCVTAVASLSAGCLLPPANDWGRSDGEPLSETDAGTGLKSSWRQSLAGKACPICGWACPRRLLLSPAFWVLALQVVICAAGKHPQGPQQPPDLDPRYRGLLSFLPPFLSPAPHTTAPPQASLAKSTLWSTSSIIRP